MSTNVLYEPPPVRIAYGVDISADWVAVVRAERKGSKWISEPCVSAPTQGDPAAAMGPHLARMTSEMALGKAVIAGAMPIRQSSLRWLSAPFPSASKARKVLPALLDIQLPFPLETCRYAFPILQRTETGTVDALALAVRESDLAQRLQDGQGWRVDPHVLDHEGLALWDTAAPTANVSRMICYWGHDRTSLVYGVGNRIEAAMQTQVGANALSRDETTASQWIAWAQRALRAIVDQHSNTTLNWRWTGPAANETKVRDLLESQLVDAHTIQFDIDSDAPYALAASLAFRALGKTDTVWNVRAGPETHPHITRWRDRAIKRAAAVVLLATLGLGAANGAIQHRLDRENQQLDQALAQRARALSDLPHVPRGQERILAERAMETHREAYAPFLRVFAPSQLDLVRELLRTAAQLNTHFDQVTLRGNTLTLQGHAVAWEDSETIAQQLRDAGWTINMERQDAIDVERVRFRITGATS